MTGDCLHRITILMDNECDIIAFFTCSCESERAIHDLWKYVYRKHPTYTSVDKDNIYKFMFKDKQYKGE